MNQCGSPQARIEKPLNASTFERFPDVQVALAVDRHVVGHVELPAPVSVVTKPANDLKGVAKQNPHAMVRPVEDV